MSAALAALLMAVWPVAAQDIEAGKTVYKKCAACHATDAMTNKMGPHLGDVVGRTAGTVENFSYSTAMKDAGAAGLVWDEAALAEYLAAPKTRVPGTKMAFAGLKKPQDIADIVAYLKALGQ